MTNRSAIRDIDLKFRVKRLFWGMGAYARPEVDLAGIGFGGRSGRPQFTDIDVLGVRITPDFSVEYQLADCKAGRNVSAVERVYWLKGVMAQFGATQGYLVKQTINQSGRELAGILGIRPISSSELLELETGMGLLNHTAPSFDPDHYLAVKVQLKQLSEKLAPAYSYVRYGYWLEKPHVNLLTVISLGRRNHEILDPSYPAHKYFVYDLVTLTALATIQLAGASMTSGKENLLESLSILLAGGPRAFEQRTALARRVAKLVPSDDLTKADVVMVSPDYMLALADLVHMLRSRSRDAVDILRYLDAILYDVVMGGANDISTVFPVLNPVTLKLTRDIARFYIAVTGISPDFLQMLEKL